MDVSNEFASVHVTKVEGRNGELLRIESSRGESSIELDAVALEALTWQTPEFFTRLVSKPFEPSN
ncbi:MAG: dihydrodiol dehydrogenase [Chloroflexi bacterium]|nr:dihydrodiol dehydrogenase [Chloroflexota bacterium]